MSGEVQAIDWYAVSTMITAYAPRAVETAVFTFRVLAGALAAIALLNWWVQRRTDERPPYDRHRNAVAWNWIYAGFILGAVSFISLDLTYRAVTGAMLGDVFVMLVWWCFANGMTVRMSARVARPRYVYRGVSVFLVAGFSYALLTGH